MVGQHVFSKNGQTRCVLKNGQTTRVLKKRTVSMSQGLNSVFIYVRLT